MGTWIRNFVLLLVIVTAFSGLVMAEYYLRHEVTGQTRRSLKERRIELSPDAAVQAVGASDKEALESLELVGVDLGELGFSGDTPLIEAARIGDAGMVDYLIGKESVIRTLNQKSTGDGQTALLCALDVGNFPIADKLMKAGATMEGQWESGVPLLMSVMMNEDNKMFDFLVKQGVPVDERNEEGITALAMAVKERKDDWVIKLLETGADVNQTGATGEALLLEVVRDGRRKTAKTLIDHKATVDVKNKAGETPLMLAIEKGDSESMVMLLDVGAKTEARDVKGKSISDRLIDSENDELVEFFTRKIGSNIPDEMLVKAFEGGKINLLKGLLEKGGDVEAETGKGDRLLKQAVLNKDQPMVELLTAFNADPGKVVVDALLSGEPAILKILLRNGADANEPLEGNVGLPLSLVLRASRYDFAEILLSYGANPDPEQSNGLTLIEEAESRGDDKAVSILRDYCADYREEVYSEQEAAVGNKK
ncbi:MAG: hypothetical protein GXP30_11085 [Verrucomicrobia bacterium]|nr:hypothetical protein [Verrucomicrobiota bacterium]